MIGGAQKCYAGDDSTGFSAHPLPPVTPSMQPPAKPPGSRDAAAVLLGYLNFSSGAFDAAAWRAMNDLFADVEPAAIDGAVAESAAAPERVAEALVRRLGELETTEAAFRDATQARWAVEATFRDVLPAYRRFRSSSAPWRSIRSVTSHPRQASVMLIPY